MHTSSDSSAILDVQGNAYVGLLGSKQIDWTCLHQRDSEPQTAAIASGALLIMA